MSNFAAIYVIESDGKVGEGWLVYHNDAGMYLASKILAPYLWNANNRQSGANYMNRHHPKANWVWVDLNVPNFGE